MDNLIMLISMLVSFLAVAGAFAVFPYVSRRTLCFGISVPEDIYGDERVVRLRRAYVRGILIAGALFSIAVVLLLYLPSLDAAGQGIAITVLIFVNLAINGAIYFRAYNAVKLLKAENGWNKDAPQLVTVDTGFRKRRSIISPLWFISYIVVIAATVAVSFLYYDKLPAMLPIRFNNVGEAVGFVEKSYKILLFTPVTQLIITLIMLFVYYSINKSRQQIDPANKEVSLMQNMVFRYRWSAFSVFCGLAMLLIFGVTQLSILGIVASRLTVVISLILPLLIIGAVIVLAVTTGQSGSRVKVARDGSPAPQKAAVREDDSNWKYGVWYYNPDDPSLFVEKRVGIGWTVNWARPMAWIIVVGILAVVAVSLIYGFSLDK